MGETMLKYVLHLQIILSYIQCFNLCYSNTDLFLCSHGICMLFISHLVAQTICSHSAS